VAVRESAELLVPAAAARHFRNEVDVIRNSFTVFEFGGSAFRRRRSNGSSFASSASMSSATSTE
jgi:hypothetical protein